MGKSALVTNIAENVALKHGKPVALFSLEMSDTELAQRFVASQARMSGDKLRKGQVARNDWPKVVKACQALEKAPLWIDDSSDIDILELRAKARRLHAKEANQGHGGLGIVIVDYLQLMRADHDRRQPRRAGRPDEPRPEDPRPRARRAGDRGLPAEPLARAAPRQAPAAVGPARVRHRRHPRSARRRPACPDPGPGRHHARSRRRRRAQPPHDRAQRQGVGGRTPQGLRGPARLGPHAARHCGPPDPLLVRVATCP